MIKILTNYTYNASTKTLILDDLGDIEMPRLYSIVNETTGRVFYHEYNSLQYAHHKAFNKITFTGNQPDGSSDGDTFTIKYDFPAYVVLGSGGGSGDNIYNTDGSQTDILRTYDGSGQALLFTNLDTFSISANVLNIIASGGVYLDNGLGNDGDVFTSHDNAPPTWEPPNTGTGTVTSVDITPGTGISAAGGPITTSGSITITNTAPDQTVVLSDGTGISVTGTYPNFTITNTAPSTVTPAALTKSDDTNVTLTLGGTPATALLQATSLTLGWSGTLSPTRGGTGQNSSASTGVAQVAAGTWSFSTALANGTTATTQSASDNSTKLATTAYVDTGLALYLPIVGRTYTTTTGNGLALTTSTLTTGNLVSLASTGTAAGSNTQTVLDIATSGANGTSTQTTYGLQVANTHTGTTSTNIALKLTASGGTNNYPLMTSGGFNVINGTSGNAALDIWYGRNTTTVSPGILIGAETSSGSVSRSVNTNKHAFINAVPYNNGTGGVILAYFNATSTQNSILIGGGTGTFYAATDITFYTASATNTASGTLRGTIDASGNWGIGAVTPSARLTLPAGTATAGTAPLRFTSGTNLTTAITGAMEYDGTNLIFTRTGTTRESVMTANAVNSVSPTAPNRTITVVIDGTTYYISAKTTND